MIDPAHVLHEDEITFLVGVDRFTGAVVRASRGTTSEAVPRSNTPASTHHSAWGNTRDPPDCRTRATAKIVNAPARIVPRATPAR